MAHIRGKKSQKALERQQAFQDALACRPEGFFARAEQVTEAHTEALKPRLEATARKALEAAGVVVPDDRRLTSEDVETHWQVIASYVESLGQTARMKFRRSVAHSRWLDVVSLRTIFGPLLQVMASTLEGRVPGMKKAAELTDLLADGPMGTLFDTNEQYEEALLEAGTDLAAETSRLFAFAHLGDTNEQWKMVLAADYADEWYNVPGSQVHLRTYYVCNRLWGYERCHTATLSASWKRRHDDPIATKQRWYCPTCEARYTPNNGVLAEMRLENTLYYVKLDCLPDWAKDMKAMLIQKEHPTVRTAAELLDRLPAVAPCTHEWLFPAPGKPGSFKFDGDYFQTLEEIKWECLWSFIDPTGTVELPAKKAKKDVPSKNTTPWVMVNPVAPDAKMVALEEC